MLGDRGAKTRLRRTEKKIVRYISPSDGAADGKPCRPRNRARTPFTASAIIAWFVLSVCIACRERDPGRPGKRPGTDYVISFSPQPLRQRRRGTCASADKAPGAKPRDGLRDFVFPATPAPAQPIRGHATHATHRRSGRSPPRHLAFRRPFLAARC